MLDLQNNWMELEVGAFHISEQEDLPESGEREWITFWSHFQISRRKNSKDDLKKKISFWNNFLVFDDSAKIKNIR